VLDVYGVRQAAEVGLHIRLSSGVRDGKGEAGAGGADVLITVEAYIAWKQPWILEAIRQIWPPAEVEEELTEEQKALDRLMRQKPWPNAPGRRGAVRRRCFWCENLKNEEEKKNGKSETW